MHLLKRTAMLLSIAALSSVALADGVPTPASDTFRVDLTAPQSQAVSGRLLLFAVDAKTARADAKNGKVNEVEFSPFSRQTGAVAAREITHLTPGHEQMFNADEVAFPSGFSQLPPGDYLMQAVLDVNHDYNYGGRGPGDLISEVFEVKLPAASLPKIKLVSTVPEDGDMWAVPKNAPAAMAARAKADGGARQRATHAIDFVSPSLTAFWGRPMRMKGWVLTPPGYEAASDQRYPVVYYTHGYGGNLRNLLSPAFGVYEDMKSGKMPPMIWVFLDESSATGTHEFADSVNNGPWGHALTSELIPNLESIYRMDGKASGRFLNGHSSGGWATLWLQTRYPKVFGGTWSTSPDPSDFHDFTGPDIYAANANVYQRPDGLLYPLMRDKGEVLATFKSFAQIERVLGPYGGQLASFEWVFSPRGADGRPEELFDRDTGAVDPTVAAYWHDHYDIANLVKTNWSTLKTDLDGKIHLYVGTADTFYLDGAAHKLKAVLDGLGATSDFRFIPGKTHFDLYAKGDDRDFLLPDMAWQMYRSARPQSTLKPTASTP
jgi:enterochelin esterase-like enzyme